MTKDYFITDTLENAWLKALNHILSFGKVVNEEESFWEIRNLHVSYSNAFEIDAPRYVRIFGKKFLDYMHRVYSPGGDPVTGRNYYNLIYKQAGIDQVHNVTEELKANPFSRSAIIVLTSPDAKKKPCITEVGFSIRQNFLHMSVIFKSSDIVKKFIPDMVELSHIHKEIARTLHISRGDVAAIILAAQVYEKDLNLIQREVSILKKGKHYKIEDIIENWDKEAQKWDDNLKNPNHYVNFENGYSRFLQFMNKEIPVVNRQDSLIALDSGCGTGAIADILDKKGYQTIGVDISPKMLSFAHQAGQYRQYVLANSLDVPYQDEFFDVICSRGVLVSHVGKKYVETFLKEHRRVLKSGGIFMFDFITHFEVSEIKKKKKKASMTFDEVSKALKDNNFEVLGRSGEDINRVNAIVCKKI